MKIAVVTNTILKDELLATGLREDMQVEWLDSPQRSDATAYIDLLFSPGIERIKLWEQVQPELVIVNSMVTTLDQLPPVFVRFNAWRTFLKRPVAEAACKNDVLKEKTERVFAAFNRLVEWVPDIPGFISARVVSMIINEAYFALDEKVSTEEEIDTAMKLGTNYPYGPFAWSKLIGLKNIYQLLDNLSETNPRYTAAPLLQQEAQSE